LTEKEAFKLGFLTHCADQGMNIEETRLAIRQTHAQLKQAGIGDFIGSAAGGAKNLVKGILSKGLSLGVPTLLAAPPLIGAGIGLAAAKATEEDMDPEEAKKQELLAEYQRAISLAHSRRH
jgi:hypothetical protein